MAEFEGNHTGWLLCPCHPKSGLREGSVSCDFTEITCHVYTSNGLCFNPPLRVDDSLTLVDPL